MMAVDPTLSTNNDQNFDDSSAPLNISDHKKVLCKHDIYQHFIISAFYQIYTLFLTMKWL